MVGFATSKHLMLKLSQIPSKERAIVQQIYLHIPKPDPMLLPIYDDEGPTTFDMFSVKIAMDLYDQLAGVKGTKYENYTLTAKEVLEREPYIKRRIKRRWSLPRLP